MTSSSAVIDRATTCPHLLRVFWQSNRNNSPLEYKNVVHDKFPDNEMQIYTWSDATLKEIGDLLKSTVASSRQKNVTLSFDLVYPDRNGVHVSRHVSFYLSCLLYSCGDLFNQNVICFLIGLVRLIRP
jgi:hypothetical protein